jgi:hypothetical protein
MALFRRCKAEVFLGFLAVKLCNVGKTIAYMIIWVNIA